MALERDTPDGRNTSTENQSDIVERLREGASIFAEWPHEETRPVILAVAYLCAEAADEIESLRSDCSELEMLADARCAEKQVVEDDLRAAEAEITCLRAELSRRPPPPESGE